MESFTFYPSLSLHGSGKIKLGQNDALKSYRSLILPTLSTWSIEGWQLWWLFNSREVLSSSPLSAPSSFWRSCRFYFAYRAMLNFSGSVFLEEGLEASERLCLNWIKEEHSRAFLTLLLSYHVLHRVIAATLSKSPAYPFWWNFRGHWDPCLEPAMQTCSFNTVSSPWMRIWRGNLHYPRRPPTIYNRIALNVMCRNMMRN